MNKQTFSNYGWIVVCVIVISIMIAMTTPFANFVAQSMQNKAEMADTKVKQIVQKQENTQEVDRIVNLDGIVQTIRRGDTYTLPPNEDVNFVGYLSSENNLYEPGAEVLIDSNISFQSIYLNLEMYNGERILNLDNEYLGIRFYTKVDTDTIEIIKNTGATITQGTIITPIDFLIDKELTFESGITYTNIEYSNVDNYQTENGFIGIFGSLSNITESNANKNFVGRGYITISYENNNGYTISKTFYAAYIDNNYNNNAYSIAKLCNDYRTNNTENYNMLSAAIKEKVDYYADLYIIP